MFFTLAVSAATPALCAELADRARVADPAVMPIPGPAVVAWRSPDGRAALLHWGGPAGGNGPSGTGGASGAGGTSGGEGLSAAGGPWGGGGPSGAGETSADGGPCAGAR